jgi:hypothetical protein
MEGQRRYLRGSGGGMAWDVEAALGATAADRTGGGGTASDQRRDRKEERTKWAAKAGWASFGNFQRKLRRVAKAIGPN